MKTKNLSLIIVLILFTINAYSRKVDPNVVTKVAENAYKLKKSDFSITDIELKKLIPYTEGIDTLFYIANFDNGFIIVSADNSTIPILGYSIDSNFDNTNTPPALIYLLNCYKKEIIEIKEQKISADKKIEDEWNSLLNGVQLKSANTTLSTVGPLLSTYWHQGEPYNNYCPPNCPAGCTAVAMAQVLYHWKCKVNATGQHSYNTGNQNYGVNGVLSADFGNANYQWNAMSTYNGNDEKAKLIYHCGVSVDMNYSTDGSKAGLDKAESALQTYFGFKDQAQVRSRINHPFDWISILKSNLNKGWPIIYQGQDKAVSSTECHAWVIDGYNSSDQFHCNWGWLGIANGYFSLGGLNPTGNNKTHDFNELQKALVDIEPQRSVDIGTPQLTAKTFTYNSNGYTLTIPAVDGATSYQWITSNGTITGTGTTAVLKSDCSATVQVRAYNSQCDIYSPYSSNIITIDYGTIAGPGVVCSSGTTFSVPNKPSGATITWSATSTTNNLTINASTGYAYATNGTTGTGTITAVISTSCGSKTLPTINVAVAGPPTPTVSGAPTAKCGYNYVYHVDQASQAAGQTFYWESDILEIANPYDKVCNALPVMDGEGTISCTVTACGISKTASKYVSAYLCETLLISPNPSTNETIISIESNSEDSFDTSALWDLEVYDQTQQLKVKKSDLKEKNIKLQTSDWNNGVYIIKAKIEGRILSGKLIVKH